MTERVIRDYMEWKEGIEERERNRMKYTDKQFNRAFDALRKDIDGTGYGNFVSDDMIRKMVKAVLNAALNDTE